MGFKLQHVLPVFALFMLIASTAKAQIFDVTKAPFGGRPNTDITQALLKAWTAACASPRHSTVVVPRGLFKFVGGSFKGPCKAPIGFLLQGTLQAPPDGSHLPRIDTWISFDHVDRLHVTGGGVFDGQGAMAWKANDCHKNTNCKSIAINLRFNFVTNSRIEGVTTKDSKNFHVNVLGCTNIAFNRFTVSAPGTSINTDGIHIGRSIGVNITDSHIATGDDCISIGEGTKHLNVHKVTCGPGHGISIGSLGRYPKEDAVTGIIIKNCTLSNTMNGVRIKTWPSSPSASTASDIHFEDIIFNNVGNPILIDQEYCPYNQCKNQVPSKVKISNVSFRNIKGTSSTPLALKLVCSRGNPCENVELTDIDIKCNGKQGPLTSQCANVRPRITRVVKALACAKATA